MDKIKYLGSHWETIGKSLSLAHICYEECRHTNICAGSEQYDLVEDMEDASIKSKKWTSSIQDLSVCESELAVLMKKHPQDKFVSTAHEVVEAAIVWRQAADVGAKIADSKDGSTGYYGKLIDACKSMIKAKESFAWKVDRKAIRLFDRGAYDLRYNNPQKIQGVFVTGMGSVGVPDQKGIAYNAVP